MKPGRKEPDGAGEAASDAAMRAGANARQPGADPDVPHGENHLTASEPDHLKTVDERREKRQKGMR